MSRVLLWVAMLGIVAGATAQERDRLAKMDPSSNACVACHVRGDEGTDKLVYDAEDVHLRFHARMCVLCHGGNEKAEDPLDAKDDSFVGAPEPAEVEAICTRCHPDKAKLQEGSHHATLPYPEEGDDLEVRRTKRPTCIDCHPAHAVKPPTEEALKLEGGEACAKCHVPGGPGSRSIQRIEDSLTRYADFVDRMTTLLKDEGAAYLPKNDLVTKARARLFRARYLIHTWDADRIERALRDQETIEEFDPSTNSCVTCHLDFPHGKRVFPFSSEDVHAGMMPRCVGCHGGNPRGRSRREAKDGTFRGVPTPKDVDALCAQCHAQMLADQEGTKHSTNAYAASFAQWKVFLEQPTLEARIRPHCTVCHLAHHIVTPDPSMLEVDSKRACGICHTSADPGGAMASDMRRLLREFEDQIAYTRQTLDTGAARGMRLDEAYHIVESVPAEIRKATQRVHHFDAEQFREALAPARASLENARGRVSEIEHEWAFQSRPYQVSLAAGSLALLALLLFFKMRSL